MNAMQRTKKFLSILLTLVLVVSLLPVTSQAADSSRTADTIFFATDRHEETSKLQSLLSALEYEPGLVVLGGDHVNNTNSGSLASITEEIHSIHPNADTFFTYAAHDPNVSEDSSNPYAFARTGEVYEGEDYYVYGVDQDDMQSSSSASSATAAFLSWAETTDASKVIFVMCHMPIHSRRGDNAGGATWMTALNEAGQTHDIVFLWGHNHTGESSTDTAVYFVGRGGSLTPQGGSTGEIAFTYMNAGYVKNGYASMIVIEDEAVNVTRYSTSGSATATYTTERLFAGPAHSWQLTESLAATCNADGYNTYVCGDCGETKTEIVAAYGHTYTEETVNTCTGSMTIYTCTVCGDSYSEENATETTYDTASSLVEGETYVITASNYALTYSASGAAKTSVSASGGSITSEVTDEMLWTYSNGMLSNSSSGTTYYLTASRSSSGSNRPGSSSSYSLSFSTSGSSCSYSSNKLKVGSYYLYYSNSSAAFTARTSGSTVTLYQMTEAVGGTGEHVYETETVEPTCTEAGSVTYTCTACGYSYSEVIQASGAHAYEAESVEATCTETGSVTYTCTACGDSYTEQTAALGHVYDAVVTEPTCESAGYTTYTCENCGDSYVANETVALGHVYESVTVEPTCTEEGSVVYSCACGDSYTETLTALGHSYTAVVTEPTCESTGYTTYTCENCGDSYVADEAAALGHAFETVTVEPTCTEGGYTTNSCTRCGAGSVYDETAALGHSYEAVVTEATCETAGHTTYTCDVCGDSYTADNVAALGHTYETVTVEATCETAGSITNTCTVCGDSIVETIAALSHAYETVTVEPTCETEGSVSETCTVCGDANEEVLAALGHAYETVTVEASCETEGSVTVTCANCGDSTVEALAALGHAYDAEVTEATCETSGYTTYTCETCGDSYTADEVAALGHAYDAVVTETTCETSGYTTYTCETCGDSYTADEVAALGHAYDAVVTESTCETAGYTTYTCTNCGDSYVTEETVALGHSYTSEEADGYLVYTCGTCGDSYSEALEGAISYEQVSVFSEGGQYVITVYSGSKYYALSHEGNELSALQVTVSGGVITSEITEDMLWDYDGSTLSYESNGSTYYLYAAKASGWMGWFGSGTLIVSTSNSSACSISSNKLKIGSYYLRYSNGITVTRSSSSATTSYLFERTEN